MGVGSDESFFGLMRSKISIFLVSFFFATSAFSGVGVGDNRFFFQDEFLFEEYIPPIGDGSIECVYDAINFFPLAAPYYTYFRNSDIKLVENLYENNISAIYFSKRMADEAFLLPSDGDTSPLLIMDSLIKKMCPRVQTQPNHKYKKTGYYEDYLLVKTTNLSNQKIEIEDNIYKNQVFSE